jgi:hypothetical protein
MLSGSLPGYISCNVTRRLYMNKIKVPEGEKFFLFLVYVALVGAALILLIDYQMKRDIVRIGREIKGATGSQGGYNSSANHPGNLHSPNLGGMAGGHDAGMEAGNAVEHDPFPVRTVARPRDASGRFAAPEPDTNSGNGSAAIQPGREPVES